MIHGDFNYLKNIYENINDINKARKISLFDCQLTSIDSNTFNDFTNLNELYLSNNQLTSLNVGIFNPLNSLTHLSLSGNKLTTLDENIFNGLNNLIELSLSGNQLNALNEMIFKGLNNLKVLSLFNNQIKSLPSNIFNGLNNLSELNLSKNELTILHPNIFNGLINLRELSLFENLLSSLDVNIFKDLTELQILHLHNNDLNSLKSNTFSSLERIKVISLYKNATDFISFIVGKNEFDCCLDGNENFIFNFSEFLSQFKDNEAGQRSPYLGGTFKNYKVDRFIGSGSYANVFSCLDLNDNSTKAIKIYTQVNNIEDIDKLKTINCEFIIKYHTSFQDNNLQMVVFEYAEKGDLDQVIKNHQKRGIEINLSRIFHWTVQATQGLRTLHENRIIHRDIKPANIFLSKDDKIKLGDLGIAKDLKDFQQNSGRFTNAGTPLYVSPEIINDKSYTYNTDVWSLGCVVYELLFLKPAFSVFSLERNVDRLDFKQSILTGITKKMLTIDRNFRPTSDELYEHLMELNNKYFK